MRANTEDFDIHNESLELQDVFDAMKSEETGRLSFKGLLECFKVLKMDVLTGLLQENFDKIVSQPINRTKDLTFQEFQMLYRSLGYRKDNFQTIKNSKLRQCCFALSSGNQISYMQGETLHHMRIFGEEDSVDLIERRIKEGYSLRSEINAKIFLSKKSPDNRILPLNDVWVWIDKCKKYKQNLEEQNQDGDIFKIKIYTFFPKKKIT